MHPNCEIACRDDTQSVDSDEEKTVFPLKFCLHFNVMTKRLGRQKKKKKMGGGRWHLYSTLKLNANAEHHAATYSEGKAHSKQRRRCLTKLVLTRS